MRYISATKIHDGYGFVDERFVLQIDDEGVVVGLGAIEDLKVDRSMVETYEGILCPGFINVHCHLELSHLHQKVDEATGLVGFVSQIPLVRKAATVEERYEHIIQAGKAMWQNGIVAVGDIANTADTAHVIEQLPLHMHTFVECMGLLPEQAKERFSYAQSLLDTYASHSGNRSFIRTSSIVPHAPYSVSEPLMEMIAVANAKGSPVTIHNQESLAETQFFENKTGDLLRLYEMLKIAPESVQFPEKSSLRYSVDKMPQSTSIILVHNTFTQEQDISYLSQTGKEIHFCLCPNANWYIERTLPNVALLVGSGYNICLGTDSLASNYGLSIYDEIKQIRKHFPYINLETALSWGTINGAKALKMESLLGSFELHKKPGVNLLKKEGRVIKLC